VDPKEVMEKGQNYWNKAKPVAGPILGTLAKAYMYVAPLFLIAVCEWVGVLANFLGFVGRSKARLCETTI